MTPAATPPAPIKAAKPRTDVEINGRIIDIAHVIPFKMTTWRALRPRGIDPMIIARTGQREELVAKDLEPIAITAIQLVDRTLSENDILDALTISDIVRLAIAVLQAEQVGNIDPPTSTASLPSPSDGAGDQAISLN